MNALTILKAVNMKKGLPAVITGLSTAVALGIAFVKAVKTVKAEEDPIIEGSCTSYDDMECKEMFEENVNDIHNDEVEDEEPEAEVIEET